MNRCDVYLHDLGFALGDTVSTLEDSAARGRLRSRCEDLRQGGFERHRLAGPAQNAYHLARAAVERIGAPAAQASALLYATCLPLNGNVGEPARYADSRDVKALMDFPASRLQAALGLEEALVLGINQQACTGLLGSLRVARALLVAEPDLDTVLCLTADRFPEGALYEQSYNLISDGAAGCLVSRSPRGYRLVASHGLTNGALAQASDDETVGSFFAYASKTIGATLSRAGLSPGDIDWIVPQNTHGRAWPVLARLLGLQRARIFDETRAEVGHVISGDNLINLERLQRSGLARPGERLLLFMAGYGLNFQAAILEVVG
jgi:3-oxoacyl-[acyl-carrier-protein] synthase III